MSGYSTKSETYCPGVDSNAGRKDETLEYKILIYEIVFYNIKTDELEIYDGPWPFPCVLIDEYGYVFERTDNPLILKASDNIFYIGEL